MKMGGENKRLKYFFSAVCSGRNKKKKKEKNQKKNKSTYITSLAAT